MKLCVAFDLASKDECIRLAKELKGLDIWLKIGLRSYLRDGFTLIEELKKIDSFKIFLDLKLYDIPNTTADACEELAKLDVDMINIHASAGALAMQSIMKRLQGFKKRPLILAVSALTSFDEKGFYELYKQSLREAVLNFAKLSYENSLDGMVCSVFESLLIKEHTSYDFLTLCPGIRGLNDDKNDQARTATVREAKEARADFIVVGRPIYKSLNPRLSCEQILEQIHSK